MPIIGAAPVVALLLGAAKMIWGGAPDGIDHSTYQAVFLSSSSLPSDVYFGKLERLSDGYYKLSNAYYLRASSDKAAQDSSNVTLTKMTTE